jgi:transposase
MIAMTRSAVSVSEPTLYVAFELGKKEWKLGMTSGPGVVPIVRTVASAQWRSVERALAEARRRFGLAETVSVVSCYEAGRDGFWIHRALLARGIANRVVDSASIEVNRRARRLKTDDLDARKLVTMLVRVCGGEPDVWREVHVPSVADEARRHGSRERTTLVQDRTRLRNQARSWLVTFGGAWPRRRTGASILLEEGLVWRQFRNRRQIGGLLGFAPVTFASGDLTRDQGISRAGNARLQAATIQLAWNWVQWQPHSALTQWFHAHFGPRRRARRIGIVALARKLLIALWRYVSQGVVPSGAVLTATA